MSIMVEFEEWFKEVFKRVAKDYMMVLVLCTRKRLLVDGEERPVAVDNVGWYGKSWGMCSSTTNRVENLSRLPKMMSA